MNSQDARELEKTLLAIAQGRHAVADNGISPEWALKCSKAIRAAREQGERDGKIEAINAMHDVLSKAVWGEG